MRTRKTSRLGRRVSLPLCLTLSVSTGAFAQSAPPAEGHVEDVVVSGAADSNAPADSSDVKAFSQQQATKFQNKPQAVTVITEQQIQNLNITSLQGAQKLVPTLNYKFSNVRNLTINIRGFGAASSSATDGIFGGVPIYIDGVYQPRPGQAVFDIPDLVGVQVLKGPQGTSGGQDSTGGTVNLSTALPSFTALQAAELTYGSYNQVQFKGSSTGPIADSDKLAYRLSVFTNDYQGRINNTLAGQDLNDWHAKSARAQILYAPSEDFSARFVFDYSHVNQACCVGLFQGVVTNYANGLPVANNWLTRMARIGFAPPTSGAPNNQTTAQIGYQQTAQESHGAAAIVRYVFNGLTVDSISSYRGWDFHPNNRSNYGWVQLNTNSNGHVSPERSVTQDLKISTAKGELVEASGGVFFLWEQLYNWGLTTYGRNAGVFYGAPANGVALNNAIYNYLGRQTYNNPETREIAPYGQVVYHATPELDITAGARYSYYSKTMIYRQYKFSVQDFSGFTPAQQRTAITATNAFIGADGQYTANSNHGFFSALASASYKFTPETMGYVTVARGGRDGGPNAAANLPAAAPKTVLPETLENYEVGFKGQFLDNRLLTNIAAFVMIDHNYITNINTLLPSGATVSYLANAQSAVSRGVELDVRYQPIDGLNTYFSAAYDDAFYSSFTNAPCPFELQTPGVTSCNFTGKRLSLVPRWAAAGGVEYSQTLGQLVDFVQKPLVGYAGADFTFQTSTFSDTSDSLYSVIPAYALVNFHAGIKFEDSSWDLQAFVNNAANVRYWINVNTGTGGVITGNVGAPLTAGLILRARL